MNAIRLVVLLLSLMWGHSVWSQNVLENTEFDTDLNGWVLDGVPLPVWDSMDIDGSGSSGSAWVVNTLDDTSTEVVALAQCIENPTPGLYGLSLAAFIPGGQATNGSVIVRSVRYDGPGCIGGANASSGYFVATSNTPDSWREIVETVQINPRTTSVSFVVGIRKTEAGGSFEAFVDSAMLLGDNIFSDDFDRVR